MPAKKEIKKLLSVTDNRLKELREQKGFTQLNVQMETGIDQSDYSKLERGLRKPTYNQAALLSHLFDTSIDYIYGFTLDPRPYPRIERPEDDEPADKK
ncbi:helix-turn-helix domain-containing protein [Ihubacter sp. rT4E-8]|uniref:helix-turn-helix domain-containing protein n=1 Tax=Ihubacter sp. rT4E-8 TaxID=3242369 RepID=UPI003CFAB778